MKIITETIHQDWFSWEDRERVSDMYYYYSDCALKKPIGRLPIGFQCDIVLDFYHDTIRIIPKGEFIKCYKGNLGLSITDLTLED